jgi:hypothetical protein
VTIYTAPGSSDLDTWRKRHRTEPCYNTTSLWIPPYACMQRRRPGQFREGQPFGNLAPKDKFYTQHARVGQFIWDVTIPNAEGVQRQDPSEFCFNGPLVIPPLSYAECCDVNDGKCQVLHNGETDGLPNFTQCTPVEDEWYVLSGGSCFSAVSHDINLSAGRSFMHTVWVSRGKAKSVQSHGRYSVSANDLGSDEYLELIASPSSLIKDLELLEPYVTAQHDGLFLVSFSCRLTSSDAANGDTLTIGLSKYDYESGGELPTPYAASRKFIIEYKWTGAANTETRTEENVAFSGFENMRKFDSLVLKNESTKKITIEDGQLSIVAIGSRFDDGSSVEDSDNAPDNSA